MTEEFVLLLYYRQDYTGEAEPALHAAFARLLFGKVVYSVSLHIHHRASVYSSAAQISSANCCPCLLNKV